jgi:predicted nuclease of predicted toxin-antitoxin system
VRFLVDNQLPPALARFIAADLGAEAAHVATVGLRDATDTEIWAYASANGLIVISKDEDFTGMVLRSPGAGLIWVRVGNCRREFLLDLFRRVWPGILSSLQAGERFIEVR